MSGPSTFSLADANARMQMGGTPIALSIAGSDPSGGAGIQMDLKAFQQNRVYGMAVLSLLTVQNTVGVTAVEIATPELVVAQIDAVMSDLLPHAIKTGALGDVGTIEVVAERLSGFTRGIVIDPVLVSKHGHALADDTAVAAYRESLLPIATVLTPNRFEAERLLGVTLDPSDEPAFVDAALGLNQLGSRFVVLKAGKIGAVRRHIIAYDGETWTIDLDDLDGNHNHGAGCALSATITAKLAEESFCGDQVDVPAAIRFAIQAVHRAIWLAPEIGQGCGPIESRALDLG